MLLLGSGCALFSRGPDVNAGYRDYVKANAAYKADAEKYQIAHNAIKAVTLTAEQASEYQRVRAEVRAADNDVYADLESWEQDGIEPAEFKVHRSKLKSAQTRLILLSREVTGGLR